MKQETTMIEMLKAWEVLQLTATLNLSFKEACGIVGIRLCDFLNTLMDSGVLAEAMRRLPKPTRERLVKIAWEAMGVAFAENPAEMLAAMQELGDITTQIRAGA